MLTCRQASELLSRAQEQRLAWHHRLVLTIHLFFCDGCTRLRRQLDFMRTAIRRLRDGDAAP